MGENELCRPQWLLHPPWTFWEPLNWLNMSLITIFFKRRWFYYYFGCNNYSDESMWDVLAGNSHLTAAEVSLCRDFVVHWYVAWDPHIIRFVQTGFITVFLFLFSSSSWGPILMFFFSFPFFLLSTACGRGFYKSSSQDLQCSRCPAHSFNDREGSWRCDCEDGYYRALSDPPSVACTSKSAMPLLGKHSAHHLLGSKFKQSHMRGKKKNTPWSPPGQSCLVSLQWPHESPRCVP